MVRDEDIQRASNLVLVLKQKRSKSGRVMWTWFRKKLAEHFHFIRLEALRDAAALQCTDCRARIKLETRFKTGLYQHYIHTHYNKTLAPCRANDLRNSTNLGGWIG